MNKQKEYYVMPQHDKPKNMSNEWIKALKRFNKETKLGNKPNVFYIPKKGTKDFAKVKSMMK